MSVMLGTLLLLNVAINAANYRAFHSFSKSEFNASSFRAAYKALLRIKPVREHRFVAVSTDALEKAYSVSPAFAQLKPQLEGELGRNWQVPNFSRPSAFMKLAHPGCCGPCAAQPACRTSTRALRRRTASTEMWPVRSIAPAMKAGFRVALCFPRFSIPGPRQPSPHAAIFSANRCFIFASIPYVRRSG